MSKLNEVIKTAIDNLQQIVDANTIIGTPINTDSGTTIIPVSKVSIGIASGGVDYVTNKNTALQNFGGGNGAGMSVTPVAFLVIRDTGVEILNINKESSKGDTLSELITKAPELFNKVKDAFKKKKEEPEETQE